MNRTQNVITPKVSIVVPCWGVEKYLDKCVDSLVNQTLKDIEIILIDDESPDRVPQMCDDWAKKDSRIKVIHKKNAGLGMACNSGLEIATGKYIAFCDSDDWVDFNMYEVLYKTAIETNCDAVFSGLKDVTVDGIFIKERIRVNKNKIYSGENLYNMLLDMIASAPDKKSERSYEASAKVVLYKSQIIKDNSLSFVSERKIASEDQIFNLNFIAHSQKVCIIADAFYNYRINTSSISRGVNLKRFDAIKGSYYHIVSECKRLKISGDYTTRAQRALIGATRVYICQILNSKIDNRQKKNAVELVCQDPIWRTVWENYPLKTMPIPQRFFSYCIKYENIIGMILFAKLKSKK